MRNLVTRLLSALLLFVVVSLAATACAPGSTSGPPVGTATAYYGVTAEMLDTWRAMKASDHWYYRLQQKTADWTGTSNEKYGDTGMAAAWIYLVTQDASYAAKAWENWKKVWASRHDVASLEQNTVREHFAEGVILGSWIYETLSSDDRQEMLDALAVWAEYCMEIGTEPYAGGLRFPDSDLTTGQYFGLALLDLWDVPENKYRGALLDTSTKRTGLPVGGLKATAADLKSTARNAIRAYAERLGAGGEWIESSEYNPGTLKLLLMGYQALRVAGHGDAFPEIAKYIQEAAAFYTTAWTAGWETIDQWGDEENARDGNRMVYGTWPTMAMLAGLAGETEAGKHCQWAVEQLATLRRDQLTLNGALNIRAIVSPWNPLVAGEPLDYTTPVVADASAGTGHYGVKRSDASLWFFGPNRELFVDHQSQAYAGFKLWRDGEWVIDHPVGYGTQAKSSSSVNAMLLAGLNAMQTAGVTRVDSGTDWWAMTYDTQGAYYDASFYQPPPPFVSRATRRMVYFRDASGWDVIIVRDDVTAENPTSLPDMARYEDTAKTAISEALARTGGVTKELVFWLPTGSPTQAGNTTEWTTPGGKTVRLVHLLPAQIGRVVRPGTEALGSEFTDSERSTHFQLRIWPTTARATDVLLTVVLVGEGEPPAVSVLDTADARVAGREVRFTDDGVSVR